LSTDDDAGVDLGDSRHLVEHAEWLQRHDLVRPRGLFRSRWLHDDDRVRHLWYHPLDWHSPRGRRRRDCGRHHAPRDFSLARPLFRTVYARLPPRNALRVRVDGLPGSLAADEARGPHLLRAIQRSASVHGSCARYARNLHDYLAARRTLALRP